MAIRGWLFVFTGKSITSKCMASKKCLRGTRAPLARLLPRLRLEHAGMFAFAGNAHCLHASKCRRGGVTGPKAGCHTLVYACCTLASLLAWSTDPPSFFCFVAEVLKYATVKTSQASRELSSWSAQKKKWVDAYDRGRAGHIGPNK